MKIRVLIAGLAVITAAVSASAAITVVSVKGTAAYKQGRNWVPLTAKMKLNDGVRVSTGVRSTVVLDLDGNSVTIKPLTMMKVYENSLKAGTRQTKIGLKRGSLRASITRGTRVKTVFKVATPVATSSVRGTVEDVVTGPYGTRFTAPEGSFDVQPRHGQPRIITGRFVFSMPFGSQRPSVLLRSNVTYTGDPNATDEEQQSHENFGGDSPEGGLGLGDSIIGGTDSPGGGDGHSDPSSVDVDLQWPENSDSGVNIGVEWPVK